jgi:methionyl-tRNA formyltransferase
LRVVLASCVLPMVRTLHAALRSEGHVVPLLLTARGAPGRPLSDESHKTMRALIEGLPSDLNALVASDLVEAADMVRSCRPDVLLCMAFPARIPSAILEVPRLGAANIHPSLLPRYRGPNPLAWVLRNGEQTMGVSIHTMTPALDAGPLIAQGAAPIDDDDDGYSVTSKALEIATELLPGALALLAAGTPGDEQIETQATHAPVFDRDYWDVDWSRSAIEIHNQVRAWQVASTRDGVRGPFATVGGQKVRITETSLRPVQNGTMMRCADRPIWILDSEAVSL